MSQDQGPAQIKMVDGQAGAPGDVIVEEVGKAPAAGKGMGLLPILLFAIGAVAAGAAVARLGIGV